MATDHTPPRLRLIVTIATIVIISLFVLQPIFKSYFAFMTDVAQGEKHAPRTDLMAQMAAEKAAFAAARVPIAQAATRIVEERAGFIAPYDSEDTGAMSGWSKLPKPVPEPTPAPAPELRDGGSDADGGAAETGAAAPTRADIGSPRDPRVVRPKR